MKLFFKKMALYGSIFLMGLLVVSGLLYEIEDHLFVFYGRPADADMLMFVEKNAVNFNAMFFGSSATNRAINPEQLFTYSGGAINALNVAQEGIPSNITLQILKQIEHAIEPGTDVFIELRAPTAVQTLYQNYKAPLIFYGITLDTLRSVLEFVWDRDAFTFSVKLEESYKVGKMFLYKYLGTGSSKHVTYLIFPELRPVLSQASEEALFVNRGFDYPFSADEAVHVAFMRMIEDNPSFFDARMKIFINEYNVSKNSTSTSFIRTFNYLQEHKKIAKRLAEKNVTIHFVIMPRTPFVQHVIEMGDELQKENISVIDLANPDTYPEFYSQAVSYDISHMNQYGAELLSKALYEQLYRDNIVNNEI